MILQKLCGIMYTNSGVINIIYYIIDGFEWSNKRRPFAASNFGIHVLNTETMKFEIKKQG